MAEYVTVWRDHEPTKLRWGIPVVRCRDCKHYDEIIHACDHPCVTPLRGDCPENWIFSCFDTDFCCWGKRKEVDG